MLKHSNVISDFNPKDDNISSSEKYYITNYYLKNYLNYTFDNKLMNQNIKLKFTIFGLKPNDNVEVIFNNGESYIINNTSLEVNYKYEDSLQNGFYFKIENIEENNLLLAEIKVGFLKDEYNNYFEVKDLENAFGTNSINKNKKGIIIKIPKDFDDNLYDFSIIFPYLNHLEYDVDIVYDELQLIVPINKTNHYYDLDNIFPIIPLFKINPYKQIDEIEDNKYFYILIISYDESEYALPYKNFSIRKPKVFTDTLNFKAINSIQKITDNKYYYQIKIPKGDYNSLLIENIDSSSELIMSLSKDNFFYLFIPSQIRFFMNRFFINNNKEKDLYLNYYKTEYDYGYINFVDYNYSFNENYGFIEKKITINTTKINGKINIKVNFTSLSYFFSQDTFKYYIIINAISDNYFSDYDSLYSIITNKKK